MAAPTFVSAGTLVSTINDCTVAWPAHVADDVGLLLIESAGNGVANLGTANGFAAVDDSPVIAVADATGTTLTAYWCRATGDAMASPIITDAGNHTIGVILLFRGCITTGNPWDVTASSHKDVADTSASAPGDTTTVAECLIVAAISRETDSAAAAFSAWANADLTSVGEIFDEGGDSGTGGGLGVATGVKTTAGAFGATTATVTSSVNAALTIALKPPVGGGGAVNPDVRSYGPQGALRTILTM